MRMRLAVSLFVLAALVLGLIGQLPVSADTPQQPARASLQGGAWQCWDDGSTDPCHRTVQDISMLSSSAGWAVGTDGLILRWNGTNWSRFATPTNYDLRSVSALSETDGWAVGAGGVILRWNGAAWSMFPTPAQANLFGVAMLSPTDGWAAGENGVLLHWDGSIWAPVAVPGIANPLLTVFFAVDFASATEGWLVGQEQDDFGAHAVTLRWNGVAWARVANAFEAAAFSRLAAVDTLGPDSAWAVGEAFFETPSEYTRTILHWNGSAWQIADETNATELRDIAMLSATEGWAVGLNGTLM